MAGAIKAIIATQFDASGIKRAEKAFGSLSKSISRSVGALGVGIGLASTVNLLRESAKAAAEDAKSQALLAEQLRNSVGANNELISSVERSISAMQLSASVADDEIRPAFAQLVRATGDVTNATRLTQIALDVAAGTGRDLGAVSIALSRAYAGNTTALSRLGIKAEKGVDVFAQLESQFSGAAEAAAATDPFQRLNIIFGELQEQIGIALLPELNKLADYFASPAGQKELADYAQLLKEVAGVFIFIGTTVAEFLAGFKVVGTAFSKLFSGDFKGFLDLMNGRGMVDALAKLNNLEKTASKPINTKSVVGTITGAAGSGGLAKTTTTIKKMSEAAQRLAENAQKTADAIADQNKALAEFKTELAGLTIQPLVDLGREIGQFEQNAIDSFQNIRDTVQQGILDKTIGAKGAANLLAYVNKEAAAFEKLARQRDELAAKRSLAESIFKDVKSGIVGLANLNSFLERQTETVTETVTRIVSGVKIATTRTIEELKSNGNIVSGFKDVLAKTKAFAAQLKTLRELGLDRNLYAQIVESGVEAGSQTAAAIIEGGAGTVNELNSLFADLNAVGSEIAEQTATIMYEAGETIGSALIDGLKAQEAALVEQARKMAEVFNQNFQTQVQALQTPTVEATGKETLSFTLADIKKMTGDLGTGAIAQQNAKLAAQLINRPEYTAYGTVVNVTVKADATTNGKALGAAIQAELNKYAKASK